MSDLKLFSEKSSRRTFLKQSVAALAAATFLPTTIATAKEAAKSQGKSGGKLSSKFDGVQIGATTYSWIGQPAQTAEELIEYCHKAGVNSLEVMWGEWARYAGAPNVSEWSAEMAEWRKRIDLNKVKALRDTLAAANIRIHEINCAPAGWSDEEIDRFFTAMKVLGTKSTVQELNLDSAKRLAPFAEKHGIYVSMHNHFQYAQEGFSCDPILEVSPMMMLNFDCGHYLGSTGKNPCDFIEKYQERIFSIHLKDKTSPKSNPANYNQVWGQGETPLKDVLRLVRSLKRPIHCDIELEYEIKPWSNPLKEVNNCVCYARETLLK